MRASAVRGQPETSQLPLPGEAMCLGNVSAENGPSGPNNVQHFLAAHVWAKFGALLHGRALGAALRSRVRSAPWAAFP